VLERQPHLCLKLLLGLQLSSSSLPAIPPYRKFLQDKVKYAVDPVEELPGKTQLDGDSLK
jgi:hypothetical protein